ncbi:MAG: polysaccharide deacetylase family protein [Betaproteobacteria bacterium]|nr:polysaccharide deacetylase family protein [Betaproteobacteria bacterium]
MKLGLKIDVRTRRGTREGVPQLMDLLIKHHARATFFFTLGPDHALGQTWLPGGDIGWRCRNELRGVRNAGFEVGIHAFDRVRWERGVRSADQKWTRREMRRACECFMRIFDEPAHAHGAAGWQMNRHAYRLTQRLGFRYGSDTRGTCPFLPVYNAEIMACPQLPTTLPPLDELMGRDGITRDNVAERVLRLSETPPPAGHVYTLRAEWEGMKFLSVFDALLAGWRAQGYTPTALGDYMNGIDLAHLPRHSVIDGDMPDRARPVALQGGEFLA